MFDYTELMKAIFDSHETIASLASKAGTSKATLYRRIRQQKPFTLDEITAIKDILHLDENRIDKYFFAEK